MAATGSNADMEELVKQITMHPGVEGYLILNADGIPVRHTFSENSHLLSMQFSALFQSLAIKARNAVHEMDPSNDVVVLRLRTKKHEILVAPEQNYLLIVIQTPQDSSINQELAEKLLNGEYGVGSNSTTTGLNAAA